MSMGCMMPFGMKRWQPMTWPGNDYRMLSRMLPFIWSLEWYPPGPAQRPARAPRRARLPRGLADGYLYLAA
eukprot:9694866-Heterocapsa_arctica.AAC.1